MGLPTFRMPRTPALFGSHGRKVIAGLCGYECLALLPGSPLPTISELVDRYPIIGFVLLGALAHHWYIEDPDGFNAMLDMLGIEVPHPI
jgi:hypothetical protein